MTRQALVLDGFFRGDYLVKEMPYSEGLSTEIEAIIAAHPKPKNLDEALHASQADSCGNPRGGS